MLDFRRNYRRIYRFFVSFQVELRGHYSAERIYSFNLYGGTTSTLRALLICALSPVPCLIAVMLVETVPMSPPEKGSSANRLFWFRDFFAIALMTRAIVEQFRVAVPGLKFTATQAIAMPVISSAGAILFMMAMANVIGFPLPFALVVGIPVWLVVVIVSFVVFFGRALRLDPNLLKELLRYIVVLVCQVSLTFVYPAYLYGFIHVGSFGQTLYLGLLPVIKIIAKNWICFYLDNKYDLMPQIMIFNVDVFNALYVSSSMQNSKSMATMPIMITLDAVLGWLSIMDINDLMKDVLLLQRKIPVDHPLKSASFMDVALQIIKEDDQAMTMLTQQHYSFGLAVLRLSDFNFSPREISSSGALIKVKRVLPVATLGPPLTVAAVKTFPPVQDELRQSHNLLSKIFSARERQRFVQKTAQVLFTTEFVILVEYTEVIIPFIYSIYTTTLFYLPNRAYYSQLETLDEAGLQSDLGSVILFGVIELLSLLVIGFIIRRKLGISTLLQLSFVLGHGWRIVQSNLVLWIFYTVQNSLKHNAAQQQHRVTMPSHQRQAFCFNLVLLSHLISMTVAGTVSTLFARSDYHEEFTLEGIFSPLEFLAAFDLEPDGTFEISLDIEFAMNAASDDDGRVMLYLLACDEVSKKEFLNLPSLVDSGSSSSDNSSVPPYCAMLNRTLDYYCQSFPLENQSSKRLMYQTTKTISGLASSVTNQSIYAQLVGSNSTSLSFFIDACELLGGNEGILRSCLDYPPPKSGRSFAGGCFFCPKNYPGLSKADEESWATKCIIPPDVRRAVQGTVAMNLCTVNGDCMWIRNNYVTWFYAASTVLWGGGFLTWLRHLHNAQEGALVDLHHKIAHVPLIQVVYSALAFVANYFAGEFSSARFNAVANIALIAQIAALGRTAEVVLQIAAGWKVTQLTLDRREVIRIRSVVTVWTIAFVVLKQLEVEHIAIEVVWGISWFAILFMVHYYSTANLKMLRKRFNIGQLLNLDTSLVMWKGTLFLQFRRLQKAYLFVATVTALCGADNRWCIWEWISVQGHEILSFLFYASLAYICRCQQFRFRDMDNLQIDVQVDTDTNDPAATQEDSDEPVSSVSVIPVLNEPVPKMVARILMLNPDKSLVLGTAYSFEKQQTADISSVKKENELRDQNSDTNSAANATNAS